MSLKEKEVEFLGFLNKFHMSLSMLKVCASSCGILNQTSQFSTQLNDTETNCLRLCSTNIKNTFSDFQKNTHELLGVGGDDDAEEEEEDDDE